MLGLWEGPNGDRRRLSLLTANTGSAEVIEAQAPRGLAAKGAHPMGAW